eukprot:Em0001g29a
MSAKVIIFFALLGTALAFKTPSEDEENRVSSDESQLQFRKEVTTMNVLCTPCKFVAGLLVDFVQNDEPKDTAKGLVRSECNKLPIGARQLCKKIVDNYFDYLWGKIVAGLSPQYACKAIKLC